jgi:hypothetical protein
MHQATRFNCPWKRSSKRVAKSCPRRKANAHAFRSWAFDWIQAAEKQSRRRRSHFAFSILSVEAMMLVMAFLSMPPGGMA